MIRLLAVASLIAPLSLVIATPASAHPTVCSKSRPPVIEIRFATRIRADSAIRCPLDGHETWVSTSVTIERDYGNIFNRDWGQVEWPSLSDRTPDAGGYPGGGKVAGAVKIISCVPATYRSVATFRVGGPAGSISYRLTSDSRKLDCR